MFELKYKINLKSSGKIIKKVFIDFTFNSRISYESYSLKMNIFIKSNSKSVKSIKISLLKINNKNKLRINKENLKIYTC